MIFDRKLTQIKENELSQMSFRGLEISGHRNLNLFQRNQRINLRNLREIENQVNQAHQVFQSSIHATTAFFYHKSSQIITQMNANKASIEVVIFYPAISNRVN